MRLESNVTAALESLSADFRKHALRPAAYAAARVFYDEMRVRAPVLKGVLRDSIYHWHDDKRSTRNQEVYVIGPNKVKAPHWYQIEYGHWLWNRYAPGVGWMRSKSNPNARGPGAHDLPQGRRPDAPQWVPAHPYVRPTWTGKKDAALKAAIDKLREQVDGIFAGNV